MKVPYYLFLVCILAGCSLFPARVEYFKEKVEKVPETTITHKEIQKEAAEYVSRKTKETVVAAVKANSSTNILKPAMDAEVVANSLTGSIGKPEEPWRREAQLLADKLDKLDAKLDRKMEEFKEDNNKNAGKSIEGTGLFSISYFGQFAVIAVFLGLFWIAIKVLSILNPAAGAGVSIAGKVLSGGLFSAGKKAAELATQMIHGGQDFKKRIDEEFNDPQVRERIIELFHTSHKINQSPENQEIIKKIIS